MGDFNINLLNFEDCQLTEEFINTIVSYDFLPNILQPTRITDHTATLIDNIFLILMNSFLLVVTWSVILQIIYQIFCSLILYLGHQTMGTDTNAITPILFRKTSYLMFRLLNGKICFRRMISIRYLILSTL